MLAGVDSKFKNALGIMNKERIINYMKHLGFFFKSPQQVGWYLGQRSNVLLQVSDGARGVSTLLLTPGLHPREAGLAILFRPLRV